MVAFTSSWRDRREERREKRIADRQERLLVNRLERYAGRRSTDEEERDRIRAVLDCDEKRDVFLGEALNRFGCDCPDHANPDRHGNPFQDFLQWLMDNWDNILKMIMDVLDLFSNEAFADEAPE